VVGKLSLSVISMTVILLASCASPTPFKSPTAAPSISSPIPAPNTNVSPIAISPPAPINEVVRFQIDRPLKAGTTMITGRGPAGIPISLGNLTMSGEELGAGVIGSDNRFAITVPPLSSNIRVGIALGDLGRTGRAPEEFDTDSYKGDGALMVPLVGYYLDTALVQP
jgi:hypothetical protein